MRRWPFTNVPDGEGVSGGKPDKSPVLLKWYRFRIFRPFRKILHIYILVQKWQNPQKFMLPHGWLGLHSNCSKPSKHWRFSLSPAPLNFSKDSSKWIHCFHVLFLIRFVSSLLPMSRHLAALVLQQIWGLLPHPWRKRHPRPVTHSLDASNGGSVNDWSFRRSFLKAQNNSFLGNFPWSSSPHLWRNHVYPQKIISDISRVDCPVCQEVLG